MLQGDVVREWVGKLVQLFNSIQFNLDKMAIKLYAVQQLS